MNIPRKTLQIIPVLGGLKCDLSEVGDLKYGINI
jgi:hypothetical protein